MLVRVLLALTLFAALHAMLGAAWVPVGDADVFWVAAAGRALLTSHAVPTTNLFSFSEPNRPWIMHEWLLGPLYALGLARWGAPFFVAVALVVLAAGLWIVLRATLGRAEHWLAGALLACVSTLFFLRRLQTARPTCVALLLPLLFTSLAFAPTFTLARGIACVLLEGLWANTHGSFPLGILLLTAAAIDRPRDRGRRLLAALGSLGATFVNPYGVRLHAFVWNYWSGSAGIFREIHAAIPEFGNMREAWGSLIELPELLGFAVVTIMAVAALRTRTQRWRGLLCIGLLLMAARQARHLELAGLVSCMLLVPWADGWAAGLSAQPEGNAALRGRLVRMISGLSCALGLATFAIAWSVRKPSDWINRELAFVEALPAIAPGAKLYVPFRAAGMALWYGFPRGIRVFYDPRNDCYSVQTLRDFAKLGNAQTTPAEALRILAASGTDAVLIPSTHPLAATLATAVDWRRVPDPRGVVFERRVSTTAATSAAGSSLADAWTACQFGRSRRAGAPDPPKADAPCRVMHVVSASDHRELLVGPAQCGRGPHRQGASHGRQQPQRHHFRSQSARTRASQACARRAAQRAATPARATRVVARR
jgi:hypothetical protein